MNDFLIQIRIFNIELVLYFWQTSFLQHNILMMHNHSATFGRYKDNYVEKGKKIYIKIPFTKKTLIIKAVRLKIITN